MKKAVSLVLALVMLLGILTLPAGAADVDVEETAYWDILTKSEAEALLNTVYNKSATENVIFVFYKVSGCGNSTYYVPRYAAFANENGLKMCAYGYDASDPSSNLSIMFRLLGVNSLTFPATCIYNAQTKTCYAADADTVLSLNSFEAKLIEAGVYEAASQPDETAPEADPIVLIHDSGVTEQEWEVLRLVNQHRMSMGLEPLSMFDALQEVANQRAYECLSVYSHDRPDGEPCYSAWEDHGVDGWTMAENIAYGYRDAAAVMNGWLNSPGHRQNIEWATMTHLGVGHKTDSAASYSPAWSQNFVGASCTHTGLQLSQTAAAAVLGEELETVLENADITVTASCSKYGSCRLPLIAAMCSGYDAGAAGTQTVTVSYGGATATLTVTVATCAEHSYDSGRVTKEATYTQEGSMTYTCTVCGDTKTEAIPKVELSFEDVPSQHWAANAVVWAVEQGITNGTGATTFSPELDCNHGMILTFLWRAAREPESDAALPSGLESGAYYSDAVRWANEQGMIPAGFDPDAPCTRKDAVRYIWQAAGKADIHYDGKFTDISATSPYAAAVAWAVEKGVTTGTTDTTFSPDGVCSRAEIVTFLHRAYAVSG